MDSAVALIEKLQEQIAATDSRYASLFREGVATHPIPFFGDLRAARVITVGVNPSAEEFTGNRWPSGRLSSATLVQRLIGYFKSDPHPWFEGWQVALEDVGVRYGVDAAHLDLSPRATVAFQAFRRDGNNGRRDLFLEMVRDDLRWFWQILDQLCPDVELVLLAGGVANVYMDDFLGRHSKVGRHRISFPGGKRKGGSAPVTWPMLHVGERTIPGFFCGVSPSSRNAHLLATRVHEHQSRLRGVRAS